MSISGWLNNILSKESPDKFVEYLVDEDGVFFKFKSDVDRDVINGSSSELARAQYLVLSMLVEQGLAEKNKNEYFVNSSVVCDLDEESRQDLGLPSLWLGSIYADINGLTRASSFNIDLNVLSPNNRVTSAYRIIGPIIEFSSSHKYVLPTLMFNAFEAASIHSDSQKKEYDNLLYLFALQKLKDRGADIDLSHFEKSTIYQPDSVSISIEKTDDGDLLITPNLGSGDDPEKIRKVIGQLDSDSTSSLRIGNKIVLMNEGVKKASKYLSNKKIKRSDIKKFIENPKAFFPIDEFEIEEGFSLRITGATQFAHAYFGETEESGIDWFSKKEDVKTILPIAKVIEKITDEVEFNELVKQIKDAKNSGAKSFIYEGQAYGIGDEASVDSVMKIISEKISSQDISNDAVDYDSGSEFENTQCPEPIVVDINLLDDEDLNSESNISKKSIDDSLCNELLLNWDGYNFKPYVHQVIGVRWIIGLYLSQNKIKDDGKGALLADDMGLGKTFMALSSIQHLYRISEEKNEQKKPALIVAPLSLVQNWYDEVEKVFSISPFRDIVRLQADADLPNYRIGGRETHAILEEDGVANINYSLKIGDIFGGERLDVDGRLVITTYQALSDYQFSLREINWGVVVFDEAQNIKNPNTFASRAARGLLADFKLVTTGTPVENSLRDYWTLMETAKTGFLGTYQNFRETYISPIARAAGDEVEEIRANIGRSLRDKVGALMLRRIKEDNLDALPEKKIYVGVDSSEWEYKASLGPEMKGFQKEAYESIINTATSDSEEYAIAALQKLRAVSLHPRLLNGGSFKNYYSSNELMGVFEESSKLISIISVIHEVRQRNEKCIIFCVNKALQKFLSLALGNYFGLGVVSIINGDAKAVAKKPNVETRKSLISDFEERSGFNLIIMSPVAAGVGLTVVGANNVIHYERHWNPAKEAQATDRVYRIGQSKSVNIYIPILKHPELESFDENLHKLLTVKTQLRDAVVTVETVKPKPSGIKDRVNFPDHILTAQNLSDIGWKDFEALVAELFSKKINATSCQLTSVNDHGADAVVFNDTNSYLIQCKHTQSSNYGSAKAVTEVKNAEPYYQKAYNRKFTNLIFVTNAKKLSPQVREAAKLHAVELYTFKDLKSLMEKYPVSREAIERLLSKNVSKV